MTTSSMTDAVRDLVWITCRGHGVLSATARDPAARCPGCGTSSRHPCFPGCDQAAERRRVVAALVAELDRLADTAADTPTAKEPK
jgi:hypothetical protein